MKIYNADDWEDAFDVCRERDCPLVVSVPGKKYLYTIFPSGSYREMEERNTR